MQSAALALVAFSAWTWPKWMTQFLVSILSLQGQLMILYNIILSLIYIPRTTCHMYMMSVGVVSPGPDDEQDVREVVMDLAAKYDGFGVVLGLSSGKLEAIGRECPGDTERALSQVIRAWLKRSYKVDIFGQPSWRTLVKAVDSRSGGYNHALAKKIASAHRGEDV